MALDPVEVDFVIIAQVQQPAPQVGIKGGFLSALTQPLARQPLAQPFSRASMTYLESDQSSTIQGSRSASKAAMTPVSSIRLLVVWASPPESSFLNDPYIKIAPQPPGPGLPEQAPSV